MTTAWAHLPNAALIGEVLASLKAHPGKWDAAWGAASDATSDAAWSAARSAVSDAISGIARDAAQDAAWDAARDAARDAIWNATSYMTWDVAWDATSDVIAALIAYDDAGQFMKMPVEHLQRLYRIDPHPMYLLLRPAAIVFAED